MSFPAHLHAINAAWAGYDGEAFAAELDVSKSLSIPSVRTISTLLYFMGLNYLCRSGQPGGHCTIVCRPQFGGYSSGPCRSSALRQPTTVHGCFGEHKQLDFVSLIEDVSWSPPHYSMPCRKLSIFISANFGSWMAVSLKLICAGALKIGALVSSSLRSSFPQPIASNAGVCRLMLRQWRLGSM